MHIMFFRHSILDSQGFSTALSWAIVVGGVYGCLRLIRDAMALLLRAIAALVEAPREGGDSHLVAARTSDAPSDEV